MKLQTVLSGFVPLLLILMTLLSPTSADVICDFERNQSCGYEWQSNLLPLKLVDEFAHMSTLGMMLLDLKDVNLTIAPGARLYSRYYPSFALKDVSHFLKTLFFVNLFLLTDCTMLGMFDRKVPHLRRGHHSIGHHTARLIWPSCLRIWKRLVPWTAE